MGAFCVHKWSVFSLRESEMTLKSQSHFGLYRASIQSTFVPVQTKAPPWVGSRPQWLARGSDPLSAWWLGLALNRLKNVSVRKSRSPWRSTPRHPIVMASTAKPPDPMPCALSAVLLPESRTRLSYAENPVSGNLPYCARPRPSRHSPASRRCVLSSHSRPARAPAQCTSAIDLVGTADVVAPARHPLTELPYSCSFEEAFVVKPAFSVSQGSGSAGR
jgi:hypothetical protein